MSSHGRSDIADQSSLKVSTTRIKEDQAMFVDSGYKIGKLGLASGQYGLAVKWLQRALEAIELSISNREVKLAVKEERFLILHALVRAYLNFDLVDAREYLSKALDCMEGVHGAAFPVAVIRLELMRREGFAEQDFFQEIQTAVQSMKIDDITLKIIAHYIRVLKDSNPGLATETLRRLLVDRVAVLKSKEWTESVLLLFVWTLTSTDSENQMETLGIFKHTMDELNELGEKLSEEASHASLIFIWRLVDKVLSSGDSYTAGQWCRCVLEQHILQISPGNKSIILRRFLLCALENGDNALVEVRSMLSLIPEEYVSSPATLYLLFKVALRSNTTSLAHDYLDALCKSSEDNSDYLLACAAEALDKGETTLILKCLQHTTNAVAETIS